MDRRTQGVGLDQIKSIFSLTALGILGQVGCLTITVIAVAIAGGLALDSLFNTRPWITLGLVLVSIPVTLFLMVKIVLAAASRLQTDSHPAGAANEQEAPLLKEEPLGNHSGEH